MFAIISVRRVSENAASTLSPNGATMPSSISCAIVRSARRDRGRHPELRDPPEQREVHPVPAQRQVEAGGAREQRPEVDRAADELSEAVRSRGAGQAPFREEEQTEDQTRAQRRRGLRRVIVVAFIGVSVSPEA